MRENHDRLPNWELGILQRGYRQPSYSVHIDIECNAPSCRERPPLPARIYMEIVTAGDLSTQSAVLEHIHAG